MKDVLAPGDLYENTGDVIRDDGQGNLYFVQRAGDNFRYRAKLDFVVRKFYIIIEQINVPSEHYR